MAQRLRFSDQNVTLPGNAGERAPVGRDAGRGHQLDAAVGLRFHRAVQPQDPALDPLHLSARYSPAPTVVSAAYRLQRGTSEQVDVGWQWPLDGLWGAADKASGAGPSRRAGTAWAA
jgi:LPS-assembly protein